MGGSADIGRALIELYLGAGWRVVATYRKPGSLANFEVNPSFKSFLLDLDRSETLEATASGLKALGWKWDLYIAATGDLAPIGPFLEIDGDAWERSIRNNGTAPCLSLIHI